jgi:uncharacterized membrane protein
MVSGVLVLIPVGVTLLIMGWLFSLAARLLRPVVSRATSELQALRWIDALPESTLNFAVSVLAILVLLMLLYLIGGLGQHIIGRRLIAIWEGIWLRIPLARSIYGATKQVVEALSQPHGAAFKSVVVVDFPSPGLKAIGFLTGYIEDAAGRKLAKVLIPTTPNPTTGFLQLIPAETVLITDLAIEEGFKALISGGIVAPENLLKPTQNRKHEDAGPSA